MLPLPYNSGLCRFGVPLTKGSYFASGVITVILHSLYANIFTRQCWTHHVFTADIKGGVLALMGWGTLLIDSKQDCYYKIGTPRCTRRTQVFAQELLGGPYHKCKWKWMESATTALRVILQVPRGLEALPGDNDLLCDTLVSFQGLNTHGQI